MLKVKLAEEAKRLAEEHSMHYTGVALFPVFSSRSRGWRSRTVSGFVCRGLSAVNATLDSRACHHTCSAFRNSYPASGR